MFLYPHRDCTYMHTYIHKHACIILVCFISRNEKQETKSPKQTLKAAAKLLALLNCLSNSIRHTHTHTLRWLLLHFKRVLYAKRLHTHAHTHTDAHSYSLAHCISMSCPASGWGNCSCRKPDPIAKGTEKTTTTITATERIIRGSVCL